MKNVEVRVRGPGPGRESAVRALNASASRSPASPTSRRFRTTAAARRRGAASKQIRDQRMARVSRSQVQARASRRHESLPQERRKASLETSAIVRRCRRAASRASAAAPVRLRPAAAREAEAAPHVRRARAPVPQLLTPRPSRRTGVTGENLLQLLESRLDNVVYRMGFAATRSEARQLVSHKAIVVNDKRGQHPVVPVQGRATSIAVREKAQEAAAHPERAADRAQAGLPDWVDVDDKELKGMFKSLPRARRDPAGHQREPRRRVVFEVIVSVPQLSGRDGERHASQSADF